MLMIPVTFLPAIILAFLAALFLVQYNKPIRAPWMIAFLISFALQLLLIGARHGYGVEAILAIQHITGVMVPPLAFLAFRNPKISSRLTIHLLPLLLVILTIMFAVDLLDALLAVITFGYAIALALALLKDEELLSWLPLRFEARFKTGAWLSVATLLHSATTDIIISADHLVLSGGRTTSIVWGASLAGLLLVTLGVAMFLRGRVSDSSPKPTAQDGALIERLNLELKEKELYRDPDLTLNRLARQLTIPARQISQAVNRSTGLNVSQYINNFRISAACEMLKTTDNSVTNVMLDAGFYTKSNFNREFRRVTGASPTEWQQGQTKK